MRLTTRDTTLRTLEGVREPARSLLNASRMNPMLRDMLVGPLQLIGRTARVGVPAYVSWVLPLRFSGKRIRSELNVFDLVVTGRARLRWDKEAGAASCA